MLCRFLGKVCEVSFGFVYANIHGLGFDTKQLATSTPRLPFGPSLQAGKIGGLVILHPRKFTFPCQSTLIHEGFVHVIDPQGFEQATHATA